MSRAEHKQRPEGAAVKFALSPVAPFRNTYDWAFHDETLALAALAEIVPLIRSFALLWFRSLSSSESLATARDDSFAERQERAVAASLMPALNARGYHVSSDGDFLWRREGELFGVVLPSVVGFGRFLIVYMNLWSPLLEGERTMPAAPPADFSRVAYCELGKRGVICDGRGEAWFVGESSARDAALADIARVFESGAVDAWLTAHADIRSMLSIVHPGMRDSVRRRIEEVLVG